MSQVSALRFGLPAFPSDIDRVRLLITFGGCRTLLGLPNDPLPDNRSTERVLEKF